MALALLKMCISSFLCGPMINYGRFVGFFRENRLEVNH